MSVNQVNFRVVVAFSIRASLSTFLSSPLTACSYQVAYISPHIQTQSKRILTWCGHKDDMEEACWFSPNHRRYTENASAENVGQLFCRMRSSPAADQYEHTHSHHRLPATDEWLSHRTPSSRCHRIHIHNETTDRKIQTLKANMHFTRARSYAAFTSTLQRCN